MKRTKKLLCAIALAIIALTVSMNPTLKTSAAATAASAAISSKAITLEEGAAKTLKVNGTTKKVTWSSSKKSIATVSSGGKITAKAAGQTIITASADGKKYTCKVTVVKPITISRKTLTLDINKTSQLKVTGTTKVVTWSSSNKKVATVSSNGTITAKAAGQSTITASVTGKKLTCKVTVKQPIKISNTTYSLEEGNTKKLTISGTKNKPTWTSSNTKVATVSSWGTITALNAGQTTITAKVDKKTLTCKVTVKKSTNPYVKNAPFDAKEISKENYKIVIPKDWEFSSETIGDDMQYIYMIPTSLKVNGSIELFIYKTGMDASDYTSAKEEFLQTMNEKTVIEQFEKEFEQLGITDFTLTEFNQSDYQIEAGYALKTKFILNLNKESTNVIIYNFYIGQYYVEVSATYDMKSDLEAISDYVISTYRLK